MSDQTAGPEMKLRIAELRLTTLEAQLQEARAALRLISESEALSRCQRLAHGSLKALDALNTLEKTDV
jgi:predicted O-methyltransferase YrrM